MPNRRGRPRGSGKDRAPFPAKGYKAAKAANQLKKDVKMLKKAMGQNVGVRDTERDLTSLSTSLGDYAIASVGGSFYNIGQGDADENREGNKIRALNFDIRGALSTTHIGDQYVRVIIVKWGDAPGSAGDILKYTTATLGVDGMAVINSPYERFPQQPYKILYDKVHKLSKKNDSVAAPCIKKLRISHKFKNGLEMTYGGTAAQNPTINGLRLFMAYGQVGTSSGAPQFQLKTRERFVK